VSELVIGLIVEGHYDAAVLETLARRVAQSPVTLYVRPCGGKQKLKRIFPGYLREFEHVHHGEAVEKALVVCDADQKPPDELRASLSQEIRNRAYWPAYKLHICIVRQEIETWLLADENAINSIAAGRGGQNRVTRVPGELESIADPKQRLHNLLSKVGLPATPEVYKQIAANVDLETLRQRCPSFREFEQAVRDC
jgi:hypothetical protein